MKVVSYYGQKRPTDYWTFWTEGIGIALPKAIGDATLVPLPPDTISYDVVEGDYDIAFCHTWAVPKKRPAEFVYSFLSDYVNNETKIREWIKIVQPDLLCCLQTCPEELIDFGKAVGCRIELVPWFVLEVPDRFEKTITAMCSGCVGSAYPSRTQIYDHLVSMNRSDFVLSCSDDFGNYRLSREGYEEAVRRTKYYFSGGIYDLYIPPKYYEVCAYGACLASFEMPFMERCGFVDGETYLKLTSIEDIGRILKTDQYQAIGRNAQQMIRERHTVEKRARQIREFAREKFQSICR